jgi:hypothetical protein
MVRVRAKIIQRVNDYKDGMMDDPELAAKITKFRCLINDEYEEVVAYSDTLTTSNKTTHGTEYGSSRKSSTTR